MAQYLTHRIVVFVPALMLACALTEGPQAGPSAALAQVDEADSLDPADAATRWRWIGVRIDLDRHCPPARGWTAQPLFAQDGFEVPMGLRRFCLYERTEGEPAQLGTLVGQGKLSAVAPDHMAVAPSADELKVAVWEDLRDHFLAQAGDVDLPVGQGGLPRLAFADTGPTNDVDPEDGWTDNSPHGYTLANLAEELLCGPAGCVARVTSRLALPHTDLSPDRHTMRGGYIGTLTEVAVAVRREVHAWETSGAGVPLVLNLSLGWDGGRFGGGEASPGTMPLDVQAVHAAIENAVCRGALVIAAAGNLGGGPDPEIGPLYPAGWEQRPAPSLNTCTSALGGSDPPDPNLWPAKYWPLVYAVGGLRAGGERLANTRPRGEPGLTAFGDHAVAEDRRPAPTAVLTGTSVSAAVASAAAAAVWYYWPLKKPHEVMELVYQGGEDLGRNAQFCLGGVPGDPCPGAGLAVSRVTVCGALTEACTSDPGDCPAALASLACPSAAGLDLSAADLSAFLATPPIEVDLADATSVAAVQACDGETLHYSVPPPDPCPHRQHHGLTVELWSGPQPGSNPCSSCYIDPDLGSAIVAAVGSATLYMEIDSDFEGILTAPTLIIGSDTYSLEPASQLVAGDQVIVENVPTPADATLPISLSFTLNGARSAISPMLVVEN